MGTSTTTYETCVPVSIPSQTGRALQDEILGQMNEKLDVMSQSPLKRGGPCRATL